MKLKLIIPAILIATLAMQMSCSDDDLARGTDGYRYFEGPIVIWNLSLFEQLELYVHPYRDDHTTDELHPENRLGESVLADQDIRVIQFSQNHYLTAIREQVSGGPKMLLTTATPLPIYNQYHVLMIFRDGFRLLDRDEAESIESFPGWPQEILEWTRDEDPYGYYDGY